MRTPAFLGRARRAEETAAGAPRRGESLPLTLRSLPRCNRSLRTSVIELPWAQRMRFSGRRRSGAGARVAGQSAASFTAPHLRALLSSGGPDQTDISL